METSESDDTLSLLNHARLSFTERQSREALLHAIDKCKTAVERSASRHSHRESTSSVNTSVDSGRPPLAQGPSNIKGEIENFDNALPRETAAFDGSDRKGWDLLKRAQVEVVRLEATTRSIRKDFIRIKRCQHLSP